ncbi:hypothetical protein Lser_V15G41340 [Lactuca serriola]
MVRSIKEADKPAKRGKKTETQKEAHVSKPAKGQTPKKLKSNKAAPSQSQPKKQKKPTRKLVLQSSSDSDSEYVPPNHKSAPPSESESESSGDEVSARGETPPRSPTPEIPVRSKPPSPPPVTIPVSIPQLFLIPTTQPSTTIPIHTPIFTNTTTTWAHSTATNPPVTTEPPKTTKPPTTSKPLSPTPSTETTHVLGSEELEFDSTYFSPYRVQSDDDDDEPVTKHHLKAVNEKLDQLLSSSSSGAYSEATLKALFSSVVQEHSASLSAGAKAIDASSSQSQQASLAVEASNKEGKEATAKAATKKNAQTVNAPVDNLQRSLQSERSNLEAARQAIEAANESLHANVNDHLTQLEAELAVENRIMHELHSRTSQLKMQNYKLRTATAELNDLNSEREVIRSYVADVRSILLHLLEAHDPIITITIIRHLDDKLRPALDILSRIEGVPEKKKKKIGEDDTDNEDDVYAENPKKPFKKAKSSEKELEEKYKKQQAEFEQKRKEAELLEKKKSIFPD